jgi:dihydroneopterin aldolase / 2-amino-4-hydroxy-6-hydroxymethyldihydropteridine diphosphokinase
MDIMRNGSATTAYIALGSNLGEREASLRKALAAVIQIPGIEIRRISSFMENPAHGSQDDAPDFINAAAEIVTNLPAPVLMKRLLEVEAQMGRERRTKWEPRVIDLDLLLYGRDIISTNDLIVPHPFMHERIFVLQPLAEIAPNIVHPTLNATIIQLLDRLRQLSD